MQTTLTFIGGLGGWEIVLIILVILIFFGAKKIPELARGLGKGLREFKDATNEIRDDIEMKGHKKTMNNTSPSNRNTNETNLRSDEVPLKNEEVVKEDLLKADKKSAENYNSSI